MTSDESLPATMEDNAASQQLTYDPPTDGSGSTSTISAQEHPHDHAKQSTESSRDGEGSTTSEAVPETGVNGQHTNGQQALQCPPPESAPPAHPVPARTNDWPKPNGLIRKLSRPVKESEASATGPVTRCMTASDVKPKPNELRMPHIPQLLQIGISVLRVTHRKRSPRTFSMDPATAVISWDAKASARLCVDEIRDIRVADDARNYREEFKVSGHFADRWMTAIYQKEKIIKALHLIFPTAEMLSSVVACLLALKEYRRDVMIGLASADGEIPAMQLGSSREQLDLEAVERLCKQVHINAGRSFLRDSFLKADVQGKGYLGIGEFRHFVGLLKERKELSHIWRRKIIGPVGEATDNATLDFAGFWRFLHLKQAALDMSREDAQFVFVKFSQDGRMTFASFTSYLLSSYNPAQGKKQDDMSRPLNEYYISSSHNTYLLGRQIRGESSIEGYIRVLQRGCRCVEIDCWDGPEFPIVTHGRTLSSLVSFRDVIATVAKYAFVTSPYPLIISLEVHCNKEQQLMMVYCLRDVLGMKLVTQPIVTKKDTLPSPLDLKHRILVKIKTSEGDDEPSNSNELTTSTSTTDTTENEDMESTSSGRVKTRSSRIIEVLSELAVYSKGLKFRNFALPESKTTNHIFSFSERSFQSLVKDQDKLGQLEKHNMRSLMRVYPSGYRITSTNFDPLPFWRRGVQMVALNWQTYDLGIQINDALFHSSEKAGYVLKPQMLRAPQAKAWNSSNRIRIKIEVISAQQLPRPKDFKGDDSFDPCVGVEVLWDGQAFRDRTRTVKGNGFNPIWKEKFKYDFFTNFPELVFVRFSLLQEEKGRSKEDKSAVFATYCSTLLQLQHGYRHIPMFDLQGEQFLFSTLFVKIKTEVV